MDSAKEDDGHIGYDLRENPKKSWKFSSFNRAASCSASASMQERQCKVCGKDFESLKALYGHMRHHPRRERERIQCKECGKALLSAKSLSNHMRVHSQKLTVYDESEAVKRLVVKRKRSERKRYNFNASSSISSLNESLYVTEIDQHVEQGAVCLMMLSRGVHNWGAFYAFSEFSVNDSVALGVKSLNKKKRVLTNGGGCFVSIGNECLMKKPRLDKLDCFVLYEKEEEECNEIYSGAESFEGKKVKLDVSIEKFYEDGEFEMPKLDDKPGWVSRVVEIEKESSEGLMEGDGLDEAEMGIMTSTSSKKVGFNAFNAETSDYGILDDSQKKSEIKGDTCSKIFSSRGALGGYQRMHGTKRSSMPVKTRNFQKQKQKQKQNQTSMFPEVEASSKLVKLECIENLMDKEHKCRICWKVFATGQALGGHQRAHTGKNSDTILQEIAVEQDYSDVSNDLDLDVSNMLEEETDGDAGSEQWFVVSEQHKHKPLVSLVAN